MEKYPVYLPNDLNNQIGEANVEKKKHETKTYVNWNICNKIYNPAKNNSIYYTLKDNKHIHRFYFNNNEWEEECIKL